MPTALLIRHGRSTANTAGILAGWTPGVLLDDHGREQAAALGLRLADVPIAAAWTSPLERCRLTAELSLPPSTEAVDEPKIGECHYGDWTGRTLKSLAKEPLWKVVQQHPSAAEFPGTEGESLRQVQARAVDAVRARLAEVDDKEVVAFYSHGDVIKAVLADALGLHLDQFQRLVVNPCSVSIVTYTSLRPFVERVNDTGQPLSSLTKSRRRGRKRTSDAVVGGATGTDG